MGDNDQTNTSINHPADLLDRPTSPNKSPVKTNASQVKSHTSDCYLYGDV